MAGTDRSGRRGTTSGSVGRASVGSASPVKAPPRKKKRSTIPRWARICTILGAVLMVVSGGLLVTSEALLARYEGAVAQEALFGDGQSEQRADIEGPINILLVGIDPRDSEALPLADSIMIMHVPASHDRAYLFSLPRDLVVEIPAFKPAEFNGGTGKLNAAMMYGSRVPGGGKPDRARGFELLSKTITRYTGIERFDAGAIVYFNGFKKIVDAMGGVTMYIDQNVSSEHMQPNGEPRPNNGSGSAHPYYGPQAEYKKGTRHLKGWQALDYVRQRYGLPKGDYDRQRHRARLPGRGAQRGFEGLRRLRAHRHRRPVHGRQPRAGQPREVGPPPAARGGLSTLGPSPPPQGVRVGKAATGRARRRR